MKIAIPTSGINLDAPVDSRFGRAPKLIVYNSDFDTFHVENNEENQNTTYGAGVQSAQHLSKENVDCVIARNCGLTAYETLKVADIAVCTCGAATVGEAIDKYRHGELAEIDETQAEAMGSSTPQWG